MKITNEYLGVLNNKFACRLKGYTCISRSRYLLLTNSDLTKSEFLLFCFIWDVLSDWDNKHKDYGMFEMNYEILSRQTDLNISFLRRNLKSLVQKGYVKHLGFHRYILTGFHLRQEITRKDASFYELLIGEIHYKLSEEKQNEDSKE